MTDPLFDRGALGVVFQPIVALEGGAIAGYQALRRAHPAAGPDDPGALLDRAARAGTLAALDLAWRRIALERIAAWDPCARSGLRWFLGVDGRCGDDPCFGPRATRRDAEEHRLQGIVLEVGLRDPGAERVARLARDGFPLALAGFGEGHVTMARLRTLRPDYVVLDADIVHGAAHDPLRTTLLRTVVEVGARLGFELVAQGIESDGDLEIARRVGVHYGVGTLLGRPAALPVARAA